jgi:pyrroline-5-carboxylate reductase
LSQAGVERVLSIAAGVTLASIEAAAGGSVAVIRAMPNTPALVGRGAAGLAGGSHADDNDIEWARQLLAGVGVAVVVAESALDAVTGLSGSGPAYVFLFAEAMIEAGVLNGLPRPLAETLAINTIVGAGEMLLGGRDPAQLRADVTSPGGTTAEGLRALEDHGVRAAVLDAVSRATAKSRDLGAEW